MNIVEIHGDITLLTLKSIEDALASGEKQILLDIDSLGGDLSVGLKCYDLLRSKEDLEVWARVNGNCMSAASFLLLSAPLEHRYATQHSCFLIHTPITQTDSYADLETIANLHDSMYTAYKQIKTIYNERLTCGDEVITDLISMKKEFYSDEALKYGFISRIETLYNNKKINTISMKKNFIINFLNSVMNKLKNEVYQTNDGKEIEIVSLEVGSPAEAVDGVYTLVDGTVLTIEGGILVDIVPSQKEDEQKQEDAPLDNKAEQSEIKNEDAPAEPSAEGDDKKEEEVKEAVDNLEQNVKEVVSEESEAVETPEDLQQIAEDLKKVIDEQVNAVIAKYKPLVNLVQSCGGAKRLEALKNARQEAKVFTSEQPKNEKRSLRDLMNLGKK